MFVGFVFIFVTMIDLLTRTIGEYTVGEKGPLLFVIGGIHGNEPSGVYALNKVMRRLNETAPDAFKGKIVGVHGNMTALQAQQRFIETDLNRLWASDTIRRLKTAAPASLKVDEREFLDLLKHIEIEFAKDYTEIILLDLHTTSGPKGLFSIISNHKPNQDLASALHAPVLFDLATELSTNSNRYMDEQGIRGIAFEAGQHDEPESIDNQEAAIWLTMDKLGMINFDDRTFDIDPFHYQLITASKDLPHFVKVIYRHDVKPEDGFHMYPGYDNFHEVYKGEPLARCGKQVVLCPASGLMLMPLYQKQGSDGFFIMEKLLESPLG
jgi:succinylglutamate desuccinylase